MVQDQEIKLDDLYGYDRLISPPIPKTGGQFGPTIHERYDKNDCLVFRKLIESRIRIIWPEHQSFLTKIKRLFHRRIDD